jgi:chromosome segregation ATPase
MVATTLHLLISLTLATTIGAVTAWRVKELRSRRDFENFFASWKQHYEELDRNLAQSLADQQKVEAQSKSIPSRDPALEDELAFARQRISALEAATASSIGDDQIDQLRAALGVAEAEAQAQVRAADAEIRTYQEASKRTIEQLESQLEEQHAVNRKLAARLDAALHDAEKNTAEARAEPESPGRQADHRMQGVEQENEERQARIGKRIGLLESKFAAQEKSARDAIDSLQGQLVSQREHYELRIEALQQMLRAKQEQARTNTESAFAAVHEAGAASRERLVELEDQLSQARSKLTEQETELNGVRERLTEALQQTPAALEAARRQALDSAQDSIAALEARLAQADAELATRERELASSREQQSAVSDRPAALETELKEAHAHTERVIAALQAQLARANDANVELQTLVSAREQETTLYQKTARWETMSAELEAQIEKERTSAAQRVDTATVEFRVQEAAFQERIEELERTLREQRATAARRIMRLYTMAEERNRKAKQRIHDLEQAAARLPNQEVRPTIAPAGSATPDQLRELQMALESQTRALRVMEQRHERLTEMIDMYLPEWDRDIDRRACA